MRVVPIVSPSRVQKSMRNPKKRPAPDHLHSPSQPRKKSSPEGNIDPEMKGRIDTRISEYNTRIKTDAQSEHYHHDIKTESPPGADAYKPEFKRAEDDCLGILRKVATVVKQDEHSELAVGLQSKTQEALHSYRGVPESVAVVGQTGQGKSSAIEALLGVPGITKIGSGGEAVTRVPIIYTSIRADSVACFEARVQLCDIATIRDSIRLHVANIISSLDKNDIVYTTDHGDQGDSNMTVLADHRDQGEESLTTLKGLFRGQPDFATDESVSSFMGFENSSSAKPGKSEDEIYNQCIAWTQDLCKEVITNTKKGIFAASVDDLWAKLAPYADLSEQDIRADSPLSFNPSLLVDRIEIIGDFRLKFSIGDCPGLGDINKDRETKANRYLRECQAVIVVEDISRAGDSQFLADFLDQCYKRRPHQLVIVALSKSEANLDVKNRMNVAFTAHEQRALDNLAVWKQEIIKDKKALRVRDHAGRDKFDNITRFIELEEIEIVARERSRRVSDKLLQKYSRYDKKLLVLSISAMDYMRHIEGYDKNDKPEPLLSVESTNIPELVRQLADIPRYRLEKSLVKLQKQTLPDLLDHVDFLCSITEAKAHAIVTFDFDSHEDRFRKQLSNLLDDFEEKLINEITEAIREYTPTWNLKARDLFQGWRRLHGTTIKAFLRKDGEHRTKKSNGPSWNAKLLSEIEILMHNLRNTIKGVDSKAFKKNLENKGPELQRAFDRVESAIRSDLKLHKGRLLEDGNGDYCRGTMRLLYKAVREDQESKKHSFRAALNMLENGVCGPQGPYLVIQNKHNEYWGAQKTKQKKLGEEAIERVMNEIRTASTQLSVQQKPSESALKMCANLARLVKEGRDQCNKPIRTSHLVSGSEPTVKIEE
ncbi:hypothetical protein PTMSG1_06088 [Pyrenophora teres f. maculata]|nr:hypothetical protein PTMSG1_06088 [Pyrenophora teres f. maculata]